MTPLVTHNLESQSSSSSSASQQGLLSGRSVAKVNMELHITHLVHAAISEALPVTNLAAIISSCL